MIGPAGAPARTDLPWLRRRSLRGAPAPGRIDYTHRDRRPAPAGSAAPAAPDLGPPSVPASLDLGTAPVPAPLDLDPTPPLGAPTSPPDARRLRGDARALLTGATPTLTLTRLQAGVGTLRIEAVCAAAVGDVRLAAAYALSDGTTSVLADTGGQRVAPPRARRPVLTAVGGDRPAVLIDLAQSRALSRLAVLGISATGARLVWDGTLVVRLFGGGRAEVPLDLGPWQGPAVLLSLYAVDGEYVLRAERDLVEGSVRDAAVAYGYDRITWADETTPVT